MINHGAWSPITADSELTAVGLIKIRTPQIDELSSALTGAGASVRRQQRPQRGQRDPCRGGRSFAASLGVVLYELTPSANTLEDAFLELTNIEGEGS